jgi:uncharacterized protein YdaU (DUF1376 family)
VQPIIDARAAYNATSEKLKAEADKKTDPSKDMSTKPSASTEEEEKPSASTEEEEKPSASTEVKVKSDSN